MGGATFVALMIPGTQSKQYMTESQDAHTTFPTALTYGDGLPDKGGTSDSSPPNMSGGRNYSYHLFIPYQHSATDRFLSNLMRVRRRLLAVHLTEALQPHLYIVLMITDTRHP